MTRTRRRLVQGLVLAFLLAGVCVLLWIIFHMEPVGPKDYSLLAMALFIGGCAESAA